MKKPKLSDKSKIVIVMLSLALSFIIIAGALTWESNQNSTEQRVVIDVNRQISQNELVAANGKDGNQCLVAVEGTVYKIEGSDLWKNGEHTPSENQAYCGYDLTEALKKSPHGKSKLQQLEKAGVLVQ